MSEHRGGMTLHGGYAMTVDANRKVLRLAAPDGRVCLKIALGAEGPLVEVSAAALSVATGGDLTIDCERFELNARSSVSLVAGGAITQQAGGDVTTRADGEIETEAVAQRHRARLGNIDLIANDDVTLDGERICLNCPELQRAPQAALGALVPRTRDAAELAPPRDDAEPKREELP
jgi:hypothetical protein